MATSNFQEAGSEQAIYLDLPPKDDVEVNIAIVGETGSGRSSFVNAIRRLKENDENAAKGECVKLTPNTYSHPDNPNIHFCILPIVIEHVEVEKFDLFLIFTAGLFNERHLLFANEIRSSNKSFILVRSKIDKNQHHEKREQEFNEEIMLRDLKASFVENFKKLRCREYAVYLISNHHPEKGHFDQLVKAIEVNLPSPQKECFNTILKVDESLGSTGSKNFHEFIEEVAPQNESESKIFTNDEMRKTLKHGGIMAVQREMIRRLEQWEGVKINLAVIGASGVGKSSFINAIRGMKDNDEGAAITGITETTTTPTPFPHPTNRNICFWDLPGIGTPTFPNLPTFCKEVQIETYDSFLIICAARFTDFDRELAKKVKSMGKSFFFIRTMVDNAMENEKYKWRDSFNKKAVLKTLRDDCVKKLQELDLDKKKIFLISNREPNMWDFNRLKKAILDELPWKQKEALILSLSANTKDILREKIEHLKGRVWMVAVASVIGKCSLGPFLFLVDEQLIRSKIKFYRSRLNFPESDSKEFKMLSEELQPEVKIFDLPSGQDVLLWLKSFDPDNKYNIRKRGLAMITKKPFKFVYRFLNLVLNKMERTGEAILDEMAKKATDGRDQDDTTRARDDATREDDTARAGVDRDADVY